MIVVTGAAGFLGRRLVAALRARGTPCLAASRAGGGGEGTVRWSAGEPLPMAGVTAVLHAAAHRPRRYDDPAEAEECLRVNALATDALVRAAADAGVERFVYVSSGGHVYRPLGRPPREDDPLWPSARAPYYLSSKLCGEYFVDAVAASGRIRATVVRPAAIYGPSMPDGMVATFVRRLSAGEPVRVADGGRFLADVVYVDDVASALIAAVDRGADGTFNVGGGRVLSSLAIAEAIASKTGAERSLVVVEPPSGPAPGAQPLDVSRAADALGYVPRSFDEGLASWFGEGG